MKDAPNLLNITGLDEVEDLIGIRVGLNKYQTKKEFADLNKYQSRKEFADANKYKSRKEFTDKSKNIPKTLKELPTENVKTFKNWEREFVNAKEPLLDFFRAVSDRSAFVGMEENKRLLFKDKAKKKMESSTGMSNAKKGK